MNTKYTLCCHYAGFGRTDIMVMVGAWDDTMRARGWINLEHGQLSEMEWADWKRSASLPVYEYCDKNIISMMPIKGEMAKRNIIGYVRRVIGDKLWIAEGVKVL